jgi:hypothetical protein
MTNTPSIEDLGKRIEQLVAEHIAAARQGAHDAIMRAFVAAAHLEPKAMTPPRPPRPARSQVTARARTFQRRPPEEVAALGERLYQAVCANPGVGMVVLSKEVGSTAGALHRPMTLLRRAGRVRSVGERHLTRYFPMAAKAAGTA